MKRVAERLNLVAIMSGVLGLVVLVFGVVQRSGAAELAGAGLCSSAIIILLFAQIFHVRAKLEPPQRPGELKTPYSAVKAAQKWEQVVADENDQHGS